MPMHKGKGSRRNKGVKTYGGLKGKKSAKYHGVMKKGKKKA